MRIYDKTVRNIIKRLQQSLWALLLLGFVANGNAQNLFTQSRVQSKAVLDTAKILIGQQTQLHLRVNMPKGTLLIWPSIGDTITKDIEVIRKSGIDTLANSPEDSLYLQQSITVSAFDSGYFVIPPFHFFIGDNKQQIDSTAMFIETNPLLLEVHSIPVDTTKAIKDIKAIQAEPVRFSEIWPWILLALGIILLIAAGIYIYNRRKNNKPLISLPRKPKDPPHIIALRKLNELSDKKLWQTGAIKEYYSELTDIMREYMEDQLKFGAMEMISEDILRELEKQQIDKELINESRKVLQTADLVKFAKMKPLADENDRALKWGFNFVEATKPQVQKTDVEPEKTTAS